MDLEWPWRGVDKFDESKQLLNVPLEGRIIAMESKRPLSEKNTHHQWPQLEPVGQARTHHLRKSNV